MGKLAERLADPLRSGVYRIEATDAVEEAAALNGYLLARVSLAALDDVRLAAEAVHGMGEVTVFSGFESLLREAPVALAPLLAALEITAAQQRARKARFFAAFLDPRGLLPLDPLYNRRKHALQGVPVLESQATIQKIDLHGGG